jgi:hypothetical protein
MNPRSSRSGYSLFEIQTLSYLLPFQARQNKKICCTDTGLRKRSFVPVFSKDEGKRAKNYLDIFPFLSGGVMWMIAPRFDSEAKKERHREQFPQECKKAYELGARLAFTG